MSVPTESKRNGSSLFIVWLVVFIDLLGFGIVLPVLPRQVDRYLTDLRRKRKVR